ncbi:MAG: MATE family efflux transporter [Lachnospiraceae bacterium]|nr:MATE family efflux transporter [Lachnospiraceae bacterium]
MFKREFVSHTMMIALPIMLQNGITNFVNMLDNIMVGRIGTDPMTGVSIVNSLLFVWNLCVFGGLSGIGIFTAQYCGKGDHEGVRRTFRLQIITSVLLVLIGIAVFASYGEPLINLYLHEDGGGGSVQATMQAARSYLGVMCIGFLPFALTQAYGTTIRSHGETVAPMIASFLAVGVNLVGNYILIFGKLGAPALGVVGAAIATVISRFVELTYIIIWAQKHAERVPFVVGALRSLYVPADLTLSCIQKGMPLLLNEALWSGGQAMLTQCYSVRGLSVVSAFNISQTLANVFNVAFIAMGSATAIIIGQKLGEWGDSKVRELKEEAWKLTLFSVFLCLISASLMFAISGIFPKIYNTTDEIRALAAGLICVTACFMPVHAFNNASYFIIRSGGKTFITFLFDSCFCWAASIPAAFYLAHYTQVPILPMYAAVCSVELVKVVIGLTLVNKGIWIRDITV